MHAYRTHTCAQLTKDNVGDTVRLSGWVHNKRDHGGVLFVDLRDHYGITQIVADSDSPALPVLEKLKLESVVTIDGTVKARDEVAVNKNLPTGEIEVFARDVEIQSRAEDLPLIVNQAEDYPEETRLKYRFVDLRRERVHANIMLRSKVISSLRQRMIAQGFNEFQTPILGASSPEGARDYLVPSRLHPGRFYALPQAPQMFKQLLMVAGFDRYFQIAPCFRDEDLRADRSPEFYQLDFEMSFVTQEDVFQAIEPVLAGVFEEFSGGKSVTPAGEFPRIPYAEAMLKYGSDKPDLRNPLIISDVTDHFTTSGFGLFENGFDWWAVFIAFFTKDGFHYAGRINKDDGRVRNAIIPAALRYILILQIERLDHRRVGVRQEGVIDLLLGRISGQNAGVIIGDKVQLPAQLGERFSGGFEVNRLFLAIGAPVERTAEHHDSALIAGHVCQCDRLA